MKYEFVGGKEDGRRIEVEAPEPGLELHLPDFGDHGRTQIYIFTGDGKFHFIKYATFPPLMRPGPEMPGHDEVLPIFREAATPLQKLYEFYESMGGFPNAIHIGKWRLTIALPPTAGS